MPEAADIQGGIEVLAKKKKLKDFWKQHEGAINYYRRKILEEFEKDAFGEEGKELAKGLREKGQSYLEETGIHD